MLEIYIFYLIGFTLLLGLESYYKYSRRSKMAMKPCVKKNDDDIEIEEKSGHIPIFFLLIILIVASIFFFRAHFAHTIHTKAEFFNRDKSNNKDNTLNSASPPAIENVTWPEHWKIIMKHSKDLELIMLDSAALKCIFNSNDNKQRGFNSLYSNSVIRFGTLITNFPTLLHVLDNVIRSSHGQLKFYTAIPYESPDTLIISYTSPQNFPKHIIISMIELSQEKNTKNFHLLRGGDLTSTIAIRKFLSSTYDVSEFQSNILIPQNLEKYLFFYERGQFLECNRTLAERIPKDQKYVMPKEVTKYLSDLVDGIMTTTGQIPFMSYGTLLGWYRDCGFIPFTTDIDFIIPANEYVDDYEKAYIQHETHPLIRRIGKKEYGLEMTFSLNHNIEGYDKPHVDFFYLYDNNETTQWVPYLRRQTLRRAKCIIPRVEKLCAGEIYGNLFFIPCNFIQIIEANYGPNWMLPKSNITHFEKGMQNYWDGYWKADRNEILVYY